MNIERLNTWITLSANLGVLLGLIILVVELNQNTEIAETTAWQELTTKLIDLEQARVVDRELSEIYLKMNSEDDLDELEFSRIFAHLRSHMILAVLAVSQYNDGLVSLGQLQGILAPVRGILSTETGKQMWQLIRNSFGGQLRTLIESSMIEREPNHPFWQEL